MSLFLCACCVSFLSSANNPLTIDILIDCLNYQKLEKICVLRITRRDPNQHK